MATTEQDNIPEENKDTPPLSNHIKVIYCLIFLLFISTTSSFVVNFLYILEIREDLSLKCSCPDGEKLLSLELHVQGDRRPNDGDEDRGTFAMPHHRTFKHEKGRISSRQHFEKGAVDSGEEEILLSNHDVDGGDQDKHIERDRRKAPGSKEDNLLRSDILDAYQYVKLPVTISVESIADFCNATMRQCPPGIPGVKGEPGKPGRPGPQGGRGLPGLVLPDRTVDRNRLPGQKGDRGVPGLQGEPGIDGLPGLKGDKGDTGEMDCKRCQPTRPVKDKWMELSDDEDATEGFGSGGAFFETLINQQGGNIPGLPATGMPSGWFPVGIPGPPGLPGLPGQKGDEGEMGMTGKDALEDCCQSETSPEDLLEALSQLPQSQLRQFKGPPGDPGPPGAVGQKGDIGLTGPAGPQGQQGKMGPRGPSRGPKGNRGPRGPTGPGGPRGLPGRPADVIERLSNHYTTDTRGTPVPDGPSGPPQTSNSSTNATCQCSPGPPGRPGLPGVNGAIGPQGPPGRPGPRQSASSGVQSAKDYLNLICTSSCNTTGDLQFVVGPSGPVGPHGEKGARGAKGDSQSRRFIIGPPGTPGPKGDMGQPGEPGMKGETGAGIKGEPGLKGRWGDQGLDGIRGPVGPAGQKGQKGEMGKDMMPRVVQGPIGPQGPTGADGVPGRQGVKGERGHQGQRGKPGEKGETGPRGYKGEKGSRGYYNIHVAGPNPSDSHATPETSQWSMTEDKPPSFGRNNECKLHEISGPMEVARSRTYWGSWMRDTSPQDDANRDKIWITTHTVGNKITEYANLKAVKSMAFTQEIQLPDYWDGSGHIVYKNSLYYHSSGHQKAVRYDLTTRTIAAEADIPEARYEYNLRYLYKSETTYFDFAMDGDDLWVIYSTENGMLVASRLNAANLTIEKTVHTNRQKRSSGDAFIICGVLYATKSPLDVYSTVDYAFDLYTNEQLMPIDVPIVNRYGMSSMLTYYPNERLLYGWDKGYLMTYNVTLQSEDG